MATSLQTPAFKVQQHQAEVDNEEEEEEEFHDDEHEDLCPDDPAKTRPGQCGCGEPDTDVDEDGYADCVDACPENPNRYDGRCPCEFDKAHRGICGCDTWDDDSDGDGTPDCKDGCARDAKKTHSGQCGCGVADTDTDLDGTADCSDLCPRDPHKTQPLMCGCGKSEKDSDADGAPDCLDQCPLDPQKQVPGQCGCGSSESCLSSSSVSPVATALLALFVVLVLLCRRLLQRNNRRFHPPSPQPRVETPLPAPPISPRSYAGELPPPPRIELPPPSWSQPPLRRPSSASIGEGELASSPSPMPTRKITARSFSNAEEPSSPLSPLIARIVGKPSPGSPIQRRPTPQEIVDDSV